MPAAREQTVGMRCAKSTTSTGRGGTSLTPVIILLPNLLPFTLPRSKNLRSGLVGITAGCSVMYPSAAAFVGLISGLIYLGADKLLLKFKVDDVVNAIPVHFANGLWGCIAVGLLAAPDLVAVAYGPDTPVGWFYEWGRGSGNFKLMACQLCGICFIIGWVTVTMAPFFLILKQIGWFRVHEVDEEIGMDLSHHGASSYTFEKADPTVISKFEDRREAKLEKRASFSGASTQSKNAEEKDEKV